MKNLLNFKNYDPGKEYKVDSRREIDLEPIRKTFDYRKILDLGFKEDTSHQQELNNTLKFIRHKKKQKEKGHGDVFYTIHPSGTVRRYNPRKGDETPEGSGNDIKKFYKPFKSTKDYSKALKYLHHYLVRKQKRHDYR